MKIKLKRILWLFLFMAVIFSAGSADAQPVSMPDYSPLKAVSKQDFSNCLIKRVQRNVNEQAARCAQVRGAFYNELLAWLNGMEKVGYIKPVAGAKAAYPKNGAKIDVAIGIIDSANLLNSEKLFWESISEKVKGLRTGSPLDMELAAIDDGKPMFGMVSSLGGDGDASLKTMARLARMGLIFAVIDADSDKYDTGKIKFDKIDLAVMTEDYISAKGDNRLNAVAKYSKQLDAMEAKAGSLLSGKPVEDDMPKVKTGFAGF